MKRSEAIIVQHSEQNVRLVSAQQKIVRSHDSAADGPLFKWKSIKFSYHFCVLLNIPIKISFSISFVKCFDWNFIREK